MTCVVGICDGKGHIYMGGDSAATTEDFQSMVRTSPKVFKKGDMLIGSAGLPRVAQLLRLAFTPPKRFDQDLEKYMVIDFVNAVKELLKDESSKDDEPGLAGSSILVGIEGRLFCIYGDYQVEETVYGYNAIGCASDIAIGSLHTTMLYDRDDPLGRVSLALKAAQEHNATVRGPFEIISI